MKNLYLSITVIVGVFVGSLSINAQNVYIPDPVFKGYLLGDPSINLNMDTEIQVSEAAAFTGDMSLIEYGVYDLTGIEAFPLVHGIDVGTNYLTWVDLSNNTVLVNLYISNNYLSSLDVSNNPLLENLDCGYNYLNTLDITSNTALINLYCGYNNLTSIDLPSTSTLTSMYIDNNELLSVDLFAVPNLQYFYGGNNQFNCLSFVNNPNLTNVDFSANPLTGVDLQNGNNTNMVYLYGYNTPNLSCIEVDNVSFMTANFTWIDPGVSYSLSCGTPAASFYFVSGCAGSPVFFINQSFPMGAAHWDFGDGNTSTQLNPQHSYAIPGNYNVQLIADNCYGTDTFSLTVIQGTDIHGHVSYTGGNISNGVAIIYPYEPYYISFDTVQITNLTASGDYHFSNIPQGDYLIKVFADSTLYPNCVPTYSYSDWAWDSAVVVLHGCSFNDTADVVMQEIIAGTPGIGLLHGTIVEGIGFGRAQGDPVHGVDVKLGITGQNQIVASTTTDLLGEYTFGNLDFANYTVYADIPGLERDSSYEITLDAVTNQYINLNYIVDSVSVDILENIGIEEQVSNVYEMNVFPNPTKDLTSLTYTLAQKADVTIEMINVLGVKVQTLFSGTQSGGQYNCTFNPKNNSLQPGIYFISLTANNKTETIRLMIME